MPPFDAEPLEATARGSSPRPSVMDRVAPAVLSAAPTPFTLFQALRRRWVRALVISLVLGVVTAVVLWYLPITTRPGAAAQVRFNPTPPFVLFPVAETKEDFERYISNQAQLAKSPPLLDAVLARPEVASLSAVTEQGDHGAQRAWLETAMTVDFPTRPEVMRILVRGDRPEQMEVLANALAVEFVEQSQRAARQERQANLDRWIAEGEKARAELASLGNGAPVVLPDVGKAARLAAAQRELEVVQNEQIRVRAELDVRKKQEAEPPVSETELMTRLEKRLASDPAYQKMLAEQDRAAAAYKKYEDTAAKPEIAGAKELRELRSVEKQVEGFRKRAAETVALEAREEFQARTRQLEERLAVLDGQEKLWLARLADGAQPTQPEAPTPNGDADGALKRKDRLEARIKEAEEKSHRLKVEMDAPPRATLLGKAALVPSEIGKQLQLAGAAGFGVFALSLIGLSFLEFRARRVGSLDDVAQGLGLKVLGALPQFPKLSDGRLKEPPPPQELPWRHQLYEMVDVTRTLLLHGSDPEGLRVVLVTSAVQGEGKTSLSSQLAASLARSGRNVLLVDTDLRKPTAHRLFDLPGEPGLCEVLRGDVNSGDVIKPTRLGRLWLAPAGVWTPLTTQGLSQDAVRQMLDEWRARFDFIVLDSAPVLPVADSLVLARAADGVIFSVLRDQSCLPQLYAAWQRLEALGVRLLGVVFSGARTDTYLSDYGRVLKTK